MPMFTATAETPHGTFTKKRTAHEYAVVVVWHVPEQVFTYGSETRTYEARTFATWHRVGSKVPMRCKVKSAQRLGVYPVVSTPVR